MHSTQALVDHGEPSILVRHPSMYFKIACSLDNPSRGGLHQRDNTHAGVTCLLTGAPSPGIPFVSSKLNRGLNFVSVCLTLGTSLMAVSSSDLWVDGQEIQPGVKVLSGPFHMSAITDQHRTFASCHASLRTLPPDPLHPLAAQDIVSDSEPAFTTTLAVECKRKQADIPLNLCLGHVRLSCNADSKEFEEAAENTATILADSWMCCVNAQLLSSTSPPTRNAIQISSVQTWKISEQSRELVAAGLDSSILSPFSEKISEFHEHEFVPSATLPEEYYQTLLKALALDSPK